MTKWFLTLGISAILALVPAESRQTINSGIKPMTPGNAAWADVLNGEKSAARSFTLLGQGVLTGQVDETGQEDDTDDPEARFGLIATLDRSPEVDDTGLEDDTDDPCPFYQRA